MKQIQKQFLSLTLAFTIAFPTSLFAQDEGTYPDHEANKNKIYASFLGDNGVHGIIGGGSYLLYVTLAWVIHRQLIWTRFNKTDAYKFSDFALINDNERFRQYVTERINNQLPAPVKNQYKGVNTLWEEMNPYIVKYEKEFDDVIIKGSVSGEAKQIRITTLELSRLLQNMQAIHPDVTPIFMKGLTEYGFHDFIVKLSPAAETFYETRGLLGLFVKRNGHYFHFDEYANRIRFENPAINEVKLKLNKYKIDRSLLASILAFGTLALCSYLKKGDDDGALLNNVATPEDLAQLAKNDWPTFESILDENPDFAKTLAETADQIPDAEKKIKAFDQYIKNNKL